MRLPFAALARDPRLVAVASVLLLAAYVAFLRGLPRGDDAFLYNRNTLGPLPYATMLGFTEEQLARHVGRLLLLGPALVGLAYAGAATWRARAGDRASAGPPFGLPPAAVALVAGLASLGATAALILGVTRGRALIQDEITYRTQALLYARGRLAEDLPAWTEGREHFTIATRAGLTGKYLFGEPLVQIPGALLGLPALSHLPVAALALFAFHRALRGAADASVAAWATALLAISPMFVFTGAIGLSHTTSLACVAVAGLGLQLCREGRAYAGAAIAGTALGFGLATRIQAVGPFGGALGLWTLAALVRARRWGAVALLVGCGGAWLAAIGAYDHALTGSATTLPWYLFEPVEHFGFGRVWEDDAFVHTPGRAAANLLVTAARFNGWWLGWPASLGLLGAWWAVGRPARGAAPWLLGGLGLCAFNACYYSPGVSDTGPVYYFELLLPACALGGATIVAAARRWPRATAVALVAHLLGGTGSFYAEQAARVSRLLDAIHGRADAVLAQIAPPALLIAGQGKRVRKPGWVDGAFPMLPRDPADPVVVYTEMDDAWSRAVIAAWPDRTCWYLPGDETAVVPCAARWPAATGGALRGGR